MFVPATVLDVDGSAVGLRAQPELVLEQSPEPGSGAVVVRDLQVRIRMHVVEAPIRPPAARNRNELADLADEVLAAEPARGDDLDAIVLLLQ
ncbi:hypothetical protein FV218_10340 [Methylobacterium sp. WL69]|uniref:hypothetical protein n=1 Tax=Methylobacterium sp. WL69 TaxID=2603893 RepID=UPI0011C90776|nr:hypothetical protein [Methylobacterium sp. WL69]TXM74197.1 hypothetical protein FV218_10340 [Methylobacterium sp. WL69]